MPAPAGPLTTVSRHLRAFSPISLVIRGRGKAQSGIPGGVILDARIGSRAEAANGDHRLRPGRAGSVLGIGAGSVAAVMSIPFAEGWLAGADLAP